MMVLARNSVAATAASKQTGPEATGTKVGRHIRRTARRVRDVVAQALAIVLLLATPAFALPDWFVTLTDPGQDGLPAGSTIVYEFDITNASFSDDAPMTTVTFDVAAGNTMVSGGGLPNCVGLDVPGPTTVTCDVDPIPAGTSMMFFPEVLSSGSGSTDFTATIPGAGDDDPTNNSTTQTTTLLAGADIEVTATGPATAAAGEIVDYTYTVENLGPDPSDGFDFTFSPPPGFDTTSVPGICSPSGSDFVCSIPGTFNVGDTLDLDFSGQITVASGSTITAVGSVSNFSPGDGQSGNNLVSLDTDVTPGSDVFITKTRAADIVLVGDTTTFTLSPGYTGDAPSGLQILDSVPSNYSVVSIDDSSSDFDCSASSGNTIDCSLATTSMPGTNEPLGDIIVTVLVEESGLITNFASISSSSPIDPNPVNNDANDGGVDLQDPFVDHDVAKFGPSPALVAVGSTYNFTLNSRNLGNAEFLGTLVIEDTIPSALTATGYTENGWVCSPPPPVTGPATIRCEFDYTTSGLPAGATTPDIVISTLVNETGPIQNTATVSDVNPNLVDENLPNNTVTFGATGQQGDQSTDITVLKSASLATLPSGDVQTFTIEVLNNGPATPGPTVDSLDVEVSDPLGGLVNNLVGPNDGVVSVTVVENSATNAVCSTSPSGAFSRLLECTIDVLPECTQGVDCPVITVQTRPGGDGGNRLNEVLIRSVTTADTNQGNNRATAPYTVTDETDVTVSKTTQPNPAPVGQELVYVITAQNQPQNVDGSPIQLSTAANVVITDTLPDDLRFLSAVPSSGSCSITPTPDSDTGPGNRDLQCELGSIGPNSTQTVTVTVRPNNATLSNAPIEPGATLPQIQNQANITTTTVESDSTNNSDAVTTDI
ncbi:MAG: DUF11 domain-containing protein [Pseudomonadota bacterium]